MSTFSSVENLPPTLSFYSSLEVVEFLLMALADEEGVIGAAVADV